MISALFIFNQKGEVLISRLYRTDVKRSISDVFRIQVISSSEVHSPIITLGSTSFYHVRVNNLYVVAVTKNNANAALVFELCYRLINICKSYFGKMDEESVKGNFVVIYELIDEILDFGYPQNTESDTLKMYVTTEEIKYNSAPTSSSKMTVATMGNTSWRRNDVKYKKNEAFVDVVETVNLLMSNKGTVLRADVDAVIMMRAYLSGTPECKFGLNDRLVLDTADRQRSDAAGQGPTEGPGSVELDDCHFHPCVRLEGFETSRTITFIPPDGEFELMKYRTTSSINLPIKVLPTVVENGTASVSYTVTVKAVFDSKLSATDVSLRIPTPLSTTTVECKVPSGKAKYEPAENVIIWKIPRLQGGSESTFSASAQLTSTTSKQAWARPPIDIDFQVLMLTASGLIVRFLKVYEESGYQSVKWVRYLTKASSSYQVRPSNDSMFWRFGFHYTSSIDSLLDRDDLSIQALLDEDDLLQECKAKNLRLIDYLCRPSTLEELLGTACCEDDLRRAQLAAEVLCCDIPSIPEICIERAETLLTPFWQRGLSLQVVERKTMTVLESNFIKINTCFLNKMPVEMLRFIKRQPEIVKQLLLHIESPHFIDFILSLMKLHERPDTGDVLEWMATEQLVPMLVEFLSSTHSGQLHHVASEILKGVISMSSPSQGQTGLSEDLQNNTPASNVLAREIASRACISQLITYILHQDFSSSSPSLDIHRSPISDPNHTSAWVTPDLVSSSVAHAASVVIDLVRKNNSDYLEPYLFHTLRNRLIQVQQHAAPEPEGARDVLEAAMREMTLKIGVVHFEILLLTVSQNLWSLKRLLEKPRRSGTNSQAPPNSLSLLTLERLRLCELVAELLHCSNMSLLNRHRVQGPDYDHLGQLEGGLAALEKLAHVVSATSQISVESSQSLVEDSDIRPSKELPVSAPSSHPLSLSSPSFNSEDSFSGGEGGSSDDDVGYDTESAPPPPEAKGREGSSSQLQLPTPSPDSGTLTGSEIFTEHKSSSRPTSLSGGEPSEPAGRLFRQSLVEVGILPSIIDLFFQFPWNNLLHAVVFDLISQVLTARLERPGTRELIVCLFKDARLLHRIVGIYGGHQDHRPVNRKYGFIGHITLLTEQIILSLEHFPQDLIQELVAYVPQPAWDEYVQGPFCDAKAKDAALLGGGKPIVSSISRLGGSRWAKVDEEDDAQNRSPAPGSLKAGEPVITANPKSLLKGEFKRVPAFRQGPRVYNADFGPPSPPPQDSAQLDSVSQTAHQFTHYLASEMSSEKQFSPSRDDTSDEEDDAGWLSQSQLDLSSSRFARTLTERSLTLRHDQEQSNVPKVSTPDPATFQESIDQNSDPFTDNSGFEDVDDQFGEFGDFQEGSSEDASMERSWTWDAETEPQIKTHRR